MVSIESENNCFLSKVFDRNPRFPKKKKNADISFNKLLISEKCEYWIFHKFQLKVREPSDILNKNNAI